MAKIDFDDFSVKFDLTEQVKDAVFKRVMDYFITHKSFFGESIHQRDDTIIDAPTVMSDICDNILKFEVTYNDE